MEKKIIAGQGQAANTDLGAVTYASLLLLIGDVMAPVTSLDIQESPNQHGQMAVTIMVEEQTKDYILYEGEGSAALFYIQNGEMKSLFQGMVLRMEVTAVGETYLISIYAKTDSCRMDYGVYNMSFQDTQITSHQLVGTLLKAYPGSNMILSIPDQPLGRIAVQYQETAWTFLKRFVSEYQALVYVDSTRRGIQLRIGLATEAAQVNWDALPYNITRNTAPRQTGKQLAEQVSYQVKAYDVLPLGSQVRFHQRDLYIGKIRRTLKEGLLVNQYQLYFKTGLTIRKYHNPLLSGVSINGVVTGIQRNKVQVQMETDGLAGCQAQHWFPFSTVAASADGSGWYCMPKAGDQVRIFFPVSDEKEGYAITNIQGHNPSSPTPSDPMGNPDLKDITAPDGKMVKFIENGILLSVADEKGAVILTNDGKAEIKSDEDIEIGAAEQVYITADGDLKMTAGVKIQITSDAGSSIEITEDTVEVNASIIAGN